MGGIDGTYLLTDCLMSRVIGVKWFMMEKEGCVLYEILILAHPIRKNTPQAASL